MTSEIQSLHSSWLQLNARAKAEANIILSDCDLEKGVEREDGKEEKKERRKRKSRKRRSNGALVNQRNKRLTHRSSLY